MLGVSSSISSVVENKYNISLNGTSDYINIDSFTQHADLTNGMAWSLAVWFKGNGSATLGAHTNILFSAHSSDASNRLRIGIDADGTKGVYYADAQADQGGIGNVDLDDGNWHLVIISRPSGLDQQITVYVDGGAVGAVANTEVLWDNDLTFASIGQEYDPAGGGATTASDFFGGEIAQLAFWKTDLDSNDVDAIYNAGRNADLNAPQANYQDHGSIIGYWKMGDGLFDDIVNGFVYDQVNPGYGSNLVSNSDFSANEAESATYLNGGLVFDDWVEQNDGGLRKYEITADGQGIRCTIETATSQTWHQRITQNVSDHLDIGSSYEFSIELLASTSCTFRAAVQTTGSNDTQTSADMQSVILSPNVTTAVKDVFLCDNNSSQVVHLFPNSNLPDGEYYEIRNPRLRKINGGVGLVTGATFSPDN